MLGGARYLCCSLQVAGSEKPRHANMKRGSSSLPIYAQLRRADLRGGYLVGGCHVLLERSICRSPDQRARVSAGEPFPRPSAGAGLTLGWRHVPPPQVCRPVACVLREGSTVPNTGHRGTLNSPTATSVTWNFVLAACEVKSGSRHRQGSESTYVAQRMSLPLNPDYRDRAQSSTSC